MFPLFLALVASFPALAHVTCPRLVAWPAALAKDGVVVESVEQWMDRAVYADLRKRLLATARKAPLEFARDLDREVFAPFQELMGRVAATAVEALTLPEHYRERSLQHLVFLRRYGPDAPDVFTNVERWHRDGGYVQVILMLDGPGTEFWRGPWYRPKRRRLVPGEIAVFLGEDLAKVLGTEAAWHRAPRRHQGRAALFLRSPWLFGEP